VAGLFFAEGVQTELPISMLHGWTEYYAESYRYKMAPMSGQICDIIYWVLGLMWKDASRLDRVLHGYLAHKKQPPPRTTIGP